MKNYFWLLFAVLTGLVIYSGVSYKTPEKLKAIPVSAEYVRIDSLRVTESSWTPDALNLFAEHKFLLKNYAKTQGYKDAVVRVYYQGESGTLIRTEEIIIYKKFLPGSNTRLTVERLVIPEQASRAGVVFISAELL